MIRYRVKASESERGGESLWSLLARNVESRKIRILRRTAVTKLLRAEDEVIGVEANQAGRRIRIGARRAVILTTGGFEYNEEMKREYLAGYPIYAYGHRGNTGDGVKLAQDAGADLWHMKSVAAPMGFKFPEYESAFIMRMPANAYIIVDQDGKRFCNETGLEHYSMWMAVTTFDMTALRYCAYRRMSYLTSARDRAVRSRASDMAPTEATNGVLIIRSRSIAAGFHLKKTPMSLRMIRNTRQSPAKRYS